MSRTARMHEHSNPPGRPPQAWRATGDAAADLSPWVAAAVQRGAVVASAAVDVSECAGPELARRAHGAFSAVLARLPGSAARVWSFLPRITEPCEGGFDRYMHHNVGRALAYRESGKVTTVMPAGTCVGHASAQLVVHALSVEGTVTAVENPRQQPAWRYSTRFGPEAPPFSRAVRADGMVWASGTASVVGEESLHAGDLHAQWRETLANLHALRDCAGAAGPWQHMRAYVRDAADVAEVERLAASTFNGGFEAVLLAPLCRSELLVEVEGIAHV